MIIADLISHEAGEERVGRVYLSTAPFPGDVIRTRLGEVMVIRRTFIDLGPGNEAGVDENRLSLELKVRPT